MQLVSFGDEVVAPTLLQTLVEIIVVLIDHLRLVLAPLVVLPRKPSFEVGELS